MAFAFLGALNFFNDLSPRGNSANSDALNIGAGVYIFCCSIENRSQDSRLNRKAEGDLECIAWQRRKVHMSCENSVAGQLRDSNTTRKFLSALGEDLERSSQE